MTVVPDENLMTLICDVCGETTTGTACVLPDAEVVWTLVSDHGWSGSPFATGPHRCPRCSALPQGASPGDGDRDRGPEGAANVGGVGGVTVVTADGGLDPDAGDALRAALRGALDVGGTVVVDLARVQVIDSVGLGLLVRAHRDVRERGGRLCLAAPSRFIRTVLHTMKLDGVFPIFDGLDDALTKLRAAAVQDAPAVGAALVDVTPADAPRPAAATPPMHRPRRRPANRITV
ncbi:STAS domain-containing protein [Micromonospora sp. WMMD1082]|uniref:STAS domain-containing protein n=1 Tax=Micromonospora sp. WMMD1082 TaxID=3016104 RepID=UPI002416132D|nr:STAS domain-containing protein [Micromonospora sp. WMMD1082]MDG4797508.1 STAS domain-containing protein [Micromonospora sp. WMMD1082]